MSSRENSSSESVAAPEVIEPRQWWLYLLACKDGRTYAGIALDVDARFQVHVSGKGSRFTRSNRPLKILGAQSFTTRSAALKAEAALKRLERNDRLLWAREWSLRGVEK
jgi:putative endonuclease